jgi:type I restriction enzyme S subunit
VPVPPPERLADILSEVEDRLSVIQKVADVIEANLWRAARLRQAILKRAFEGKLVPQDPNDEPASVLLERIRRQRAERQNSAPARQRSRGKDVS